METVAELERVALGEYPTPIERMPELGDALGLSAFAVKNEGKSSSLYGGNKVRKLEYLLGAARSNGCSTVFTSGAIGSNHVLATAAHARETGFTPVASQFPQPVTDHVRENLRSLARFSPELHLLRSELLLPPHLLTKRLATKFDDDRYYIPPGGSSVVGAVGYIDAAAELAQQIEAGETREPDVVVVPASSGGTLAGLVVGFDRAGIDATLVGVPVVERYLLNRLSVSRMANKVAARVGEQVNYTRGDVTLCSGYLGAGYAEPTTEGERVSNIAAEHGLSLDPTYTAKTVAAIADSFSDERVLYWHTLSSTRPEPLSVSETLSRLPDAYAQFFD